MSSATDDMGLFSALQASQPIHLPEEVYIHDYSVEKEAGWSCPLPYSIGRYDEVRAGLYKAEIFAGERNLHVGLDIGGPLGTPVHSCLDGEVFWSGYHPAEGDYGHTVVIQHVVGKKVLYILYGHLSAESTQTTLVGSHVLKGELIAWLGGKSENGGWPPHLHLQLSWLAPVEGDLPGVVNTSQRMEALSNYPDPQLLIGRFY